MQLHLNWLAYQYRDYDGYGRFSVRYVSALVRQGIAVSPLLWEYALAHPSIQALMTGGRQTDLTIACMPPYYVNKVPGELWVYTMTEGSEAPEGWADMINESGATRLLVPCEANRCTFEKAGVKAPITVLYGGTDPAEFAPVGRHKGQPYTFLAMADRGSRKGWGEVYSAFWHAFGTKEETPDVRLILKSRPHVNNILDLMAGAEGLDPRIVIDQRDALDMREIFSMADVVCLPSRHEGWGMPHREAAMMGLPVITTRHGGLDDPGGHIWGIQITDTYTDRIPSSHEAIAGEWERVNVDSLAKTMRRLYEDPAWGRARGAGARRWLIENQTWDHAAMRLLELVREYRS